MDRVERLSRVLGYDCEVEDERLEALAEACTPQNVANSLWAYAKMGRRGSGCWVH